MLQLCSKYLENNLISAQYFTFVNSSVTLINNYKSFMANSNVTTESGGRQNMFPTETRPYICLLYTSPSPRDLSTSRMPCSA